MMCLNIGWCIVKKNVNLWLNKIQYNLIIVGCNLSIRDEVDNIIYVSLEVWYMFKYIYIYIYINNKPLK